MTATRNARRQMQGTVVNTGMDKTITVEISRTFRHSKYGKYLRRQKKYLTHDQENSAQRGDVVVIESTRPLSKRKRWRLVRILERRGPDHATPEIGELDMTVPLGDEGGGT